LVKVVPPSTHRLLVGGVGDGIHPIASFDKILPWLRQIVTDDLAPGVYPHRRPTSAHRHSRER
jgi:hypothetical protein